MCGIAGIIGLKDQPIEGLTHALQVMNKLIAHRGPDDEGIWESSSKHVGFAHRRLSIIDLSVSAHQPMIG